MHPYFRVFRCFSILNTKDLSSTSTFTNLHNARIILLQQNTNVFNLMILKYSSSELKIWESHPVSFYFISSSSMFCLVTSKTCHQFTREIPSFFAAAVCLLVLRLRCWCAVHPMGQRRFCGDWSYCFARSPQTIKKIGFNFLTKKNAYRESKSSKIGDEYCVAVFFFRWLFYGFEGPMRFIASIW